MNLPSTKILDHIVHLTPPGTVEETSRQFTKLGFTVIPGGTHTSGLTANSLVILQDGVYLELLSFTHPPSHYPPSSPERKKRDSNPWASKKPGWIDFAFLGNGTSDPHSFAPRISDIINERAREEKSGVMYVDEVSGGRENPNGTVLKWVISAPHEKHGHGTLPFFCGDVTPRAWRVPEIPPSNSRHPSTAVGIAHVRLLADAQEFTSLSLQLISVVGTPPTSATAAEVAWALDTTNTNIDANGQPRLILSLPRDAEEQEALETKGPGIYEVAFWVNKGRQGGSIRTPYGKILWVPLL